MLNRRFVLLNLILVVTISFAAYSDVSALGWDCDEFDSTDIMLDQQNTQDIQWHTTTPAGYTDRAVIVPDNPFNMTDSSSVYCPAGSVSDPLDWYHGVIDLSDLSDFEISDWFIAMECWVKPDGDGEINDILRLTAEEYIDYIGSPYNAEYWEVTNISIGRDINNKLTWKVEIKNAELRPDNLGYNVPKNKHSVDAFDIPTGEWTHIAMIKRTDWADSNDLIFYKNGQPVVDYAEGGYVDSQGQPAGSGTEADQVVVNKQLPDGVPLYLMCGTMESSPGHYLDDIRYSNALYQNELAYGESLTPDECEDVAELDKAFAADIEPDCSIDILDFEMIAGDWNKTYNPLDSGHETPWQLPSLP